MQELKFKIKGTETANVEIIPVSDGVEIVVHYGAENQKNYGSFENKPKKTYTYHNNQASPEEIIEGIKDVARRLYKESGTDKDELTKFVKFYEKKISENGWNGPFNFDKLWESWLSKKK